MSSEKFYITTPIYYVNAAPHIGHAYTTIVADCLARHYRERGQRVYFLTGTDEHGQKIQKAADALGLSPKVFVDQGSLKFRDLWQTLNVRHDDFIRTTEERHVIAVQKVLEILYASGELYAGQYGGWYCVPCETFWIESQLLEGRCPDCRRTVEYLEEKNYFFRLSKYQGWLLEYLRSHPEFVFPQTRYNEVVSFLENNTLTDLCISRPKARLGWGIPIPFDPEHVTYVWFDALINYISAVGFVDDPAKFKELWPADAHIMAKDIIRQHAIYWPIMLKALGLPLPKRVVAHGWWKMGDVKMSKSLGNVVDPVEMVERYGVDSFRYFLLRDVVFGTDGNFSTDSFEKRFNGDLANDLGNLVYRSCNMIEKYCDGKIPGVENLSLPAGVVSPVIGQFLADESAFDVREHFHRLDFTVALERIWEVVNAANRLVEQTKPWNLKKEGRLEELENFLAILIKAIRFAGRQIGPFMPQTSAKILAQVQSEVLQKGEPLFPRLEVKT